MTYHREAGQVKYKSKDESQAKRSARWIGMQGHGYNQGITKLLTGRIS